MTRIWTNKVIVYQMFKNNFEIKIYLNLIIIMPLFWRSAFSKLGAVVVPLRPEKGCYNCMKPKNML